MGNVAANRPSVVRGSETFESIHQHEEDSRCAVRGHESPSRVHYTYSAVTPANDFSKVGWVFTAISDTATRGKKWDDDLNDRMRAGDDGEAELYRQIFQIKIDDPFTYHVVKNVYDSMAVLNNQYRFPLHEKCFLSKIIS